MKSEVIHELCAFHTWAQGRCKPGGAPLKSCARPPPLKNLSDVIDSM